MIEEERQWIDSWLEDAYESRVTGDYEQPVAIALRRDDNAEGETEGEDTDEPPTCGAAASPSNSAARLQQKIDRALEDLAEQLAAGHTQNYLDLIAFYARFHHYSLANTILIQLQKPDANAVAGYVRWKQLGRQVRRHTTAAHIWCPVKYKLDDEDADEEIRLLTGFKTCYVFSDKDLVNADNTPFPVGRPAMADNHQSVLAQLLVAVERSGVSIEYTDYLPGAEGMYRRSEHQITLVSERDSHNQILILLHEWAHALFHSEAEAATWPPKLKEFQAETVAMVMGELLGVPSPYANDYLLCCGVTPEQLRVSFGHIHQLVSQMSTHLELPSTAT